MKAACTYPQPTMWINMFHRLNPLLPLHLIRSNPNATKLVQQRDPKQLPMKMTNMTIRHGMDVLDIVDKTPDKARMNCAARIQMTGMQ